MKSGENEMVNPLTTQICGCTVELVDWDVCGGGWLQDSSEISEFAFLTVNLIIYDGTYYHQADFVKHRAKSKDLGSPKYSGSEYGVDYVIHMDQSIAYLRHPNSYVTGDQLEDEQNEPLSEKIKQLFTGSRNDGLNNIFGLLESAHRNFSTAKL